MSYKLLSIEIFKHIRGSDSFKDISKMVGVPTQRLYAWETGKTSIRTSLFFYLTAKKNFNLTSIFYSLYAPEIPPFNISTNTTQNILKTKYLPCLLKKIRGKKTLEEIKNIIAITNRSSFNHWETGKRDIPFDKFLKLIDLYSGRLNAFCESLEFTKSLNNFGFKNQKANFSKRFFSLPWTPTIYLYLQTKPYGRIRIHNNRIICNHLKITEKMLTEALKILIDLELIRFDGEKYLCNKGQFYVGPIITSKIVENLNDYWFSKSKDLAKLKGFHKIEEHTVSKELYENILNWVQELREKIRNEVKKTKPEMLIHIHWQIAKMVEDDKIE
ncbi:MAG: DUF4423 domain-containing protein [Oligoflexia bacterium]|nr:DUF4423 domain-containing protein [Oligoflexia bacterium]